MSFILTTFARKAKISLKYKQKQAENSQPASVSLKQRHLPGYLINNLPVIWFFFINGR